MFTFITNKPFWVNLLAAIALGLLFLFLFLKTLGWITKHGDYLKVPAVVGLKTDAAIKLLEKQGFDVYIQDSVYTDTAARGIVLKQLPDANSLVKINRTVFVTVNRYVPPMIDMPGLEGQSLSFALKILERNHLKLGDTTFRPDFMMGSVLEQHFNGMRIADKSKIQWGSKIDLVIGGGLEIRSMPVPSLIGLTYGDAMALLEENGISPGAVIFDGAIADTASAFIYRQRPERFDMEKRLVYIQSGQLMDIWLAQQMKIVTDSTNKKNN
ncbi:MAG: PASTA domain-containing protein [Chitinophagaceae bacterium]|nr:PASTA domain-containing protein [Chitinophagaceae bacterium]